MTAFIGIAFSEPNINKTLFSKKFHELIDEKTLQDKLILDTSNCFIVAAASDHDIQENISVLPDHQGIVIGHTHSISGLNEYLNWEPKNCWGKYIAVLSDSNDRKTTIFRDPLGLKQVFFYQCRMGLLFSSNIDLLASLNQEFNEKFTIDWSYFSSFLFTGSLQTAKTPFKEVTELLPGCKLSFKNNEFKISSFWNPSEFSLTPMNDDIMTKIAPTFIDTVAKTTGSASKASLFLSGGLDSTALFLAISKCKQSNQKFNVINFCDPSVAASDETAYVKQLTQNSGIELIFHKWKYEFSPQRCEKWNKPHLGSMIINSRIELLAQLTSLNWKQTEFISGEGGDELFITNVYTKTLTDYFLNIGLHGFLNKLNQITLMNRSTTLNVLRSLLKDLYYRFMKRDLISYTPTKLPEKSWQNNEMVNLIDCKQYLPVFAHQLIENKIYPGKVQQILDVYHTSAIASFSCPGIVQIFPFLSQPLVELGLSIPTHMTFDGRYSRINFRKAISEYFNTDKVWRQSKGTGTGIITRSIQNNLKRVYELCLEGVFAKNKLVNRDLLKKQINIIAAGNIDAMWEVLFLLAVELWFEAWQITS